VKILTKKAYRECPRFIKCSVNNCPLSSQYPDIYTDIEDKQKECTLAKSIRVEIGSKYPELKYQGMTPREWASTKRYESFSSDEKENLAQIGTKSLKSHFCSLLQSEPSQEGVRVPSPQVAGEKSPIIGGFENNAIQKAELHSPACSAITLME
jgi:hypothetical protein